MLSNLPTAEVGGRERPVASGLRFHLAEDRIREFLMGENLYGEPSLALREVYQNALDACRLAQARAQFLGVVPPVSTADRPSIEFEQRVDASGRAYIDCVDLGAGMGLDELTNAFCQAGVRASDLSARIDEANDFASADPPVVLWQNSRFGIGVMSYFMIADAVTVTTARLNRDGSLGETLRMHIPGPSAMFDVVSLGPATQHGTHVRLWLKSSASVSAVSTLRDLVLLCPVHLRVADQCGLEHRWAPDELNLGSSLLPRVEGAVPTGRNLWWSEEWGAVLADGLWIEQRIWGMVVNLVGTEAPTLTADRRTAARLDTEVVIARAVECAEAGLDRAWSIVSDPDWLTLMTNWLPRVADAIVANPVTTPETGSTLHGAGYVFDEAGFLAGDENHELYDLPLRVVQWRFSRYRQAGLYSGIGVPPLPGQTIEPARPSDAVLLSCLDCLIEDHGRRSISPWAGTADSVYDAERLTGHPIGYLVERARTLGLRVPDGAESLPDSTDIVRTALSFSRRESPEGRPRPLCDFDLLQTSWQTGTPVPDVIGQLELRSLLDRDLERPRDVPTPPPALLAAASENGNGIAPWTPSNGEIGLDRVVAASRATAVEPADIVDGLRRLGFENLPDLELHGQTPTDDDLVLLSVDLDGRGPFLGRNRPASRRHLHAATSRLGQDEGDLAARLRALGVAIVSEDSAEPTGQLKKKDVLRLLGLPPSARKTLRRRQVKLMSRDGDGAAPWLDPRQPIPAWLVATKALHGRSIDTILDDYRELGYTVEDPRTVTLTPRPGPIAVAAAPSG